MGTCWDSQQSESYKKSNQDLIFRIKNQLHCCLLFIRAKTMQCKKLIAGFFSGFTGIKASINNALKHH